MKDQRVTWELVVSHLRKRNFAVLSTSGEASTPHSAGVNYGVSGPDRELVLYVMTRRHLRKARNIVQNLAVSLVVPLARRLLWSLPPPTIQLHGHAEIVDWTDEEGRAVFEDFWMGRRILKAYQASHRRGGNTDVLPEDHTRSRDQHVHGGLQHLATQESHGVR